MFAKLFELLFGKKKEPEHMPTFEQRMGQHEAKRKARDMYDGGMPLRTGKTRSASASSSSRREDDIMSNPIHPLNPLNPIGFNSGAWTPTHVSHSYSAPDDCGVSSSSSSSYDSGSSSCDSGSSSSGGGD